MSGQEPQVWNVSIQAKPGAPPEQPAAGAPVDPVPPAWVDAAESMRGTVKWMVTAFGAIGTVLFAQGFVSTPELSWEDDGWQLGLAWAVGAGGLLAIGWLIYQATALLRPTLYELGSLPASYRTLLDSEPRFYLPSDVSSFAAFLTRFEALRTQEKAWRAKLSQAEIVLAEAEANPPPDGPNPAAVAAKAEVVRARRTHDSLVGALGVYNAVRKDILDRAGFWQVSRGLDASHTRIAIAAVLAATGGVGYSLLLSAPGTDETGKTEDGASAPRIATLTKSTTPAGDELWELLDLAQCQVDPQDPGSAEIPVVVSSGKGVVSDPYTVTTLPTPTCRAITFTVINDVALVSEPEDAEITYTPSPSPSSPTAPGLPGIS